MLSRSKEDFLSGKRMRVSVLFADVRGFTSMADKFRNPEKLVRIINTFFRYMTQVIISNKGTLDKYVGDEIMAIFGAPVHHEDHALRAVRTAVEM